MLEGEQRRAETLEKGNPASEEELHQGEEEAEIKALEREVKDGAMSDERRLVETLEKGLPASEEEEEEEEIQGLEREVKEMAEKILHLRRTLPGQLRETLESSLAASRPVLPQINAAKSAISAEQDLGAREHAESSEAALVEEASESAGKIGLLKLKISSNASTMPVVLKRMRECIAAIDKLNQFDVNNIHPTFKRKRMH